MKHHHRKRGHKGKGRGKGRGKRNDAARTVAHPIIDIDDQPLYTAINMFSRGFFVSPADLGMAKVYNENGRPIWVDGAEVAAAEVVEAKVKP